ncbi:MAG: isopenicillin N synthase family oxygenase [Acidimicrobiia bacterium]|nr:isopenicillin N synthase family oxygenase [Acidimicrobiia bacterium]
MTAVPTIDVGPLLDGTDLDAVAGAIDHACREFGFFSVVNHGVDPERFATVASLAREFFALPPERKQRVAMSRGGVAWRGWFPLDGELTSGIPDHKEGYYFGRELPATDPRVQAGTPLHGPNLWPEEPAALREVLTDSMQALETLGGHLTRAISYALGLGADTLNDWWFRDPVVLLRLFQYPAGPGATRGVGEHTDYGFLTMLWQDTSGGLQVRTDAGWIDVPPEPAALVCNIGDMLDRLTRGRYRSTAHRVVSPSATDRISVPFFFDPDWDARVDALPLPGAAPPDDANHRWDGTSVHTFDGTYGEYLMTKVAKVFPELGSEVLPTGSPAGESPSSR